MMLRVVPQWQAHNYFQLADYLHLQKLQAISQVPET